MLQGADNPKERAVLRDEVDLPVKHQHSGSEVVSNKTMYSCSDGLTKIFPYPHS